jgi:hypothetical protein
MKHHPCRTRIALVGLAFAAFLLGLLWAAGAFANHSGWEWLQNDPVTGFCCGERDCAVIPDRDITDTGTGWWLRFMGRAYFIPYKGRDRLGDMPPVYVFNSKTGQWWACFYNDGKGSPRCFFKKPSLF